MRVFITGATGFVGSAVSRRLLSAGHEVVGLARSQASAEALERAGVEPKRGDLADLDLLADCAREAQGVIHCAFNHDFSQYGAAAQTDRLAIEALASGTADRAPLIVTSGLAGLPAGRTVTEADDAIPGRTARVSEETALCLARDGVRASVVRLAPTTHGQGDHGFVPALIAMARDKGVCAYVGEGENLWPAGHVEDAAALYVLALERGARGERYHASAEEGLAFRTIAQAIAAVTSLPARSLSSQEAAAHFGWMASFAQLDVKASSQWTRQTLGWEPTGASLLEDLAAGHYG